MAKTIFAHHPLLLLIMLSRSIRALSTSTLFHKLAFNQFSVRDYSSLGVIKIGPKQTREHDKVHYPFGKSVRRSLNTNGFDDKTEGNFNQLQNETSPYLLQHAKNPVDWKPWGEEAFKRAAKEEKPIFLSIGYSTCHWCHVMERESFESEAVADILNNKFIPIKVDREERPDVDAVYMSFIQATAGRGGWPMSVWLTPDLKPFVGGTYFQEERFIQILNTISEKWETDRPEIVDRGNNIIEALQRYAEKQEALAGDPSALVKSGGWRLVQESYTPLDADYDEEWGGFGRSLKFPQPTQLDFLLRLYYVEPENERGVRALEMLTKTLEMMAKGGIRDHLGGGFARYSTDRRWHVPHFEKMLYDNAQLAVTYLETYQVTRIPLFQEVAKEILDYVIEDMTDDDGGFYSAEDADSIPEEVSNDPLKTKEKKEGAFYVFTWEKLKDTLKPAGKLTAKNNVEVDMSDIFCRRYGARMIGNVDPVSDPHEELTGQNVLYLAEDLDQLREAFELECSLEELQSHLTACLKLLSEAQEKREKPHLDDKIIVSWNGLMISAFAKGYQVLGDEMYLTAAEKAASFIKANMYDESTKKLLRSYRKGPSQISGFADDYCFLVSGLIDLYEANFDLDLLGWANDLQKTLDKDFFGNGVYYTTDTSDPSILLRTKSDQDGAEPCVASVATWNLIRLGQYYDDQKLITRAEELISVALQEPGAGYARPGLVGATLLHLKSFKQIIIKVSEEHTREKEILLRDFLQVINSAFIPNKSVFLLESASDSHLAKHPNLKHLSQVLKSADNQSLKKDGKEDQIKIYVCENFGCSLPVTTVEDLKEILSV
mmetsp:Transcript_12875/g.16926  ORF Transcript_12875/g.16926 Transcript_12875/m.16926 type:complete len:829 (-) Transcript_12875:307-2793(-)